MYRYNLMLYILFFTYNIYMSNFILYSTGESLKDVASSELCNSFSKKGGNLFIRGNTYTNSKQDFQQQFRITQLSGKKSIQNITNCYDFDSTSANVRGPHEPLNKSEYQGIYPTLRLNQESGITNVIRRIKSQLGEGGNIKSFFIFFSPDEPEPVPERDDDNSKETNTINQLYSDTTYNGITQANCQAKLSNGFEFNSDEIIITPKFKGLIVYVDLSQQFQKNTPLEFFRKRLSNEISNDKSDNATVIEQLKQELMQMISCSTGGKKKSRKSNKKSRKMKKSRKSNKKSRKMKKGPY